MGDASWLAKRSLLNLVSFNLLGRRQLAREILELLARPEYLQAGLYGLKIAQELGVLTGSLYPTLNRLRRRGFITSWWATNATPRERHYRLTGAGRTELARWYITQRDPSRLPRSQPHTP